MLCIERIVWRKFESTCSDPNNILMMVWVWVIMVKSIIYVDTVYLINCNPLGNPRFNWLKCIMYPDLEGILIMLNPNLKIL